MDPGVYFDMVVITILVVITLITLILTFLHMLYGKEQALA